MGKKLNTNPKAEAARTAKTEGKNKAAAEKAQKQEDDYWDAAKDSKQKGKEDKREAEERKRQEAAARKAENKALADQEAISPLSQFAEQ